ncbi:MAG: hypothetical protein P8M16_06465 [Acidimicrobiales bacterium]|nr:hypothetical protein [Acidimicrobiales bacterium]
MNRPTVDIKVATLCLALLVTACSPGGPESPLVKPVGTTVAPVLASPGGTSDQMNQPSLNSFSDQTSAEAANSTSYKIPDELAFTATLIGGEQFDGTILASKDVLFWFWTPT